MPATSRRRRVGEAAADHRADLRHLARRAEPVEPRHQRLLQRRRNRLDAAALLAALQQQPRHFLDEQRHAAGAGGDILHHVARQRMAGGKLRHHLLHLAAIERRERDGAVMRAHAPGRTELGPRRRHDEQRRQRAALGDAAQHVERGRIGPMQILERQHQRLRLAPAITQFVRAASCRRRNSSAAKAGTRSIGSGMSRSGASKGRFSAGSSLTCASELSSSARRCAAGTSAPPKRWRPHSAIGCSGVFCRSCEQLHSTQVCGVSASRA